MDNADRSPLRKLIDGLGSLKLTVVLLALSLFLVLAGTLAQVQLGIWTVMEQYFRCWFAWVELKVFQPGGSKLPGGFPFPGGKLLGAFLVANLAVSHVRRIQVKARGTRLWMGLATTAIGVAVTWLVIVHVFDADSSKSAADPFWRVTFQLLQGVAAASILFAGCQLLFVRKAGIVLLHAGIVLMMSSELLTASFAKEGMMSIDEGQSSNFVEDTREVELAFVRAAGAGENEVVVVPGALLRKGGRISAPELPFDVEVKPGHYFKNADLREVRGTDVNPATEGLGRHYVALKRSEEAGVSTGGGVDQGGAYVTVYDKGGALRGTWLTSVALTMLQGGQRVGDWELSLRFERTYKPYRVFLKDFRFERYVGTQTPKDFSSFVRLSDPGNGVDRDVRIWMNNPLRYRGDTLYQASWDQATEATTVLQVVTNSGWMIPYVSCMIVAAGLLGQFMLHLTGFLRRGQA